MFLDVISIKYYDLLEEPCTLETIYLKFGEYKWINELRKGYNSYRAPLNIKNKNCMYNCK